MSTTAAQTAQTNPQPTPRPAEDTKSGKPGRKPGQSVKARPNTSALSLDFLSNPQAVTEEEAKRTAPTNERKPEQKAMDTIVAKMHKAWVDAGKPSIWKDLPKAKYPVAPEHAEALRYLVRRAADFHGFRPRFGTARRDANGRELVVFAILDKRPRPAGKDGKGKAATK